LPKRRDADLYFRIVLGDCMQEHDAPHALGMLRALQAATRPRHRQKE
jgi:hypothetical protein